MQMLLTMLEELFPFLFYIQRANRKFTEATSNDNEQNDSLHALYSNLSTEELSTRLNEELKSAEFSPIKQ